LSFEEPDDPAYSPAAARKRLKFTVFRLVRLLARIMFGGFARQCRANGTVAELHH
jgi:hypothetical protein